MGFRRRTMEDTEAALARIARWTLVHRAKPGARTRARRRAVECSVALVPDTIMRRLKARYGSKRATEKQPSRRRLVDVLSFSEPAGFYSREHRERYIGEVYLNERLVPEDSEKLLRLLIHGILHLEGYRHDAKNDTIRMESEEKRLIPLVPPVLLKELSLRVRGVFGRQGTGGRCRR